jgi:hypothetical protein
MEAYQTDLNGWFIGPVVRQKDPMSGEYLLPARAVTVSPETPEEGKWPRWNGSEWVYEEDPEITVSKLKAEAEAEALRQVEVLRQKQIEEQDARDIAVNVQRAEAMRQFKEQNAPLIQDVKTALDPAATTEDLHKGFAALVKLTGFDTHL